jgi:hypothetical protein
MPTTFSKKCEILADLWMNYRNEETFRDFVEYNDLGLPLAYLLSANIVESNESGNRFVEEAFELLVTALGIQDNNFESLEEMFEEAEKKN